MSRARALATTWEGVNAWDPEFNPYAKLHTELSMVPASKRRLIPRRLGKAGARGLWNAAEFLYDERYDYEKLLGYSPRAREELAEWQDFDMRLHLPVVGGVDGTLRARRGAGKDGGERHNDNEKMLGRLALRALGLNTRPFYFTCEARKRTYSTGEEADALLDFHEIAKIRAEDVFAVRQAEGEKRWPAPKPPWWILRGMRLYVRPVAPGIVAGKVWLDEIPESQKPGRFCGYCLLACRYDGTPSV